MLHSIGFFLQNFRDCFLLLLEQHHLSNIVINHHFLSLNYETFYLYFFAHLLKEIVNLITIIN